MGDDATSGGFLELLAKQAATVAEGAVALRDLLRDFRDVPGKRKRIKDIEHLGDETVHEIHENLNRTFVTPIDREDISALASALDNILDEIDAAAKRVALYEIERPSEGMLQLADVIMNTSTELRKAVVLLADPQGWEDVERVSVEVHRLENVADDVTNEAVAALFRGKDVVQVLKEKEILERLERATDYGEDAANVLSDVVAKNR